MLHAAAFLAAAVALALGLWQGLRDGAPTAPAPRDLAAASSPAMDAIARAGSVDAQPSAGAARVPVPAPAPALPPPRAGGAGGSASVAGTSGLDADAQAAALALARRIAATEAAVRHGRQQGQGEDAIYALRSTHLPAAQVAQLMEMERAEAAWRARVAAHLAECGGRDDCGAARLAPEEWARINAYQTRPAPRLSQDAP